MPEKGGGGQGRMLLNSQLPCCCCPLQDKITFPAFQDVLSGCMWPKSNFHNVSLASLVLSLSKGPRALCTAAKTLRPCVRQAYGMRGPYRRASMPRGHARVHGGHARMHGGCAAKVAWRPVSLVRGSPGTWGAPAIAHGVGRLLLDHHPPDVCDLDGHRFVLRVQLQPGGCICHAHHPPLVPPASQTDLQRKTFQTLHRVLSFCSAGNCD